MPHRSGLAGLTLPLLSLLNRQHGHKLSCLINSSSHYGPVLNRRCLSIAVMAQTAAHISAQSRPAAPSTCPVAQGPTSTWIQGCSLRRGRRRRFITSPVLSAGSHHCVPLPRNPRYNAIVASEQLTPESPLVRAKPAVSEPPYHLCGELPHRLASSRHFHGRPRPLPDSASSRDDPTISPVDPPRAARPTAAPEPPDGLLSPPLLTRWADLPLLGKPCLAK